MLHEANVRNPKAKSDVSVESYKFSLSNQQYLRGGEGVYIITGIKEKWQEPEIQTIVWVFQLILAGFVDLQFSSYYSAQYGKLGCITEVNLKIGYKREQGMKRYEFQSRSVQW